MNRRHFLGTLIGGVAAAAAVRTWPFRVYSFPSEVVWTPEIVNALGFGFSIPSGAIIRGIQYLHPARFEFHINQQYRWDRLADRWAMQRHAEKVLADAAIQGKHYVDRLFEVSD